MRRAAAARGRELGLQIMTPSLLATRPAGGLLCPASREGIEIGIRAALGESGLLKDITPIGAFPEPPVPLFARCETCGVQASTFGRDRLRNSRVSRILHGSNAVRRHLQPGERLPPNLYDLARAAEQAAPRVNRITSHRELSLVAKQGSFSRNGSAIIRQVDEDLSISDHRAPTTLLVRQAAKITNRSISASDAAPRSVINLCTSA